MRKAGLDFEEGMDYDWITKKADDHGIYHGGYAEYYLHKCWNDSKLINEADATVYKRLVDIDSTIGTELYQQLLGCLKWTTRWDIMKV